MYGAKASKSYKQLLDERAQNLILSEERVHKHTL